MKAKHELHRHDGEEETVEAPATRKDPVCAMKVGPKTDHRFLHAGMDYLFCSVGCLAKFRENPGRYLEDREPAGDLSGESPSEPGGEASAGAYTCPMHPEIRQEDPGSCPKCGMALEPVAPVSRREWTCPMHPEVVRDAPGDCPKCGMALEARTVSAE